GEQITPSKIGTPVPNKGLSGVLRAGQRAISLEVTQVTAVGGLLLPGDHVDVIASFLLKGPDLDTLQTKTVLQNVEALSVAQEAQKAAAGTTQSDQGNASAYTSGQVPEDVKQQPTASTVTLSLDPQQAEVLVSVQSNPDVKKLFAVLRAYGDKDTPEQAP